MLALAVLLLAFAGDAAFTLLSIHRARQGVVANEAYLELGGAVDAAWKSLNDFAPALGRGAAVRVDPNLPLALRMGRKHLDGALGAIDRYLEKEPGSPRRQDFESRRAQLATLATGLDSLVTELGAAAVAVDSKARSEFESHFAMLTHSLNRMRRPLRGESGLIAQRLSDDEETALSMAHRARRGGAGRGGRRVHLHAADAASARRAAGAGPAGRRRRLRPAHGRDLAGRDRRSRARVRRDGRRRPGARDAAHPIGAARDRGTDGGADRARGAQPACVDWTQRRAARRRDRRPEATSRRSSSRRSSARSIVSPRSRRPTCALPGCRGRSWNTKTWGRSSFRSWRCRAASCTRPGSRSAIDVAPGLPEVAADEPQLRQALINLVRNAREAMAGDRASGGAPPTAEAKRLELSVRGEAGRGRGSGSRFGARHRQGGHGKDLRSVLLDQGAGNGARAGPRAADRGRSRRADRSRVRARPGNDLHDEVPGGGRLTSGPPPDGCRLGRRLPSVS